MTKKASHKLSKAFTLIELIVVITIIALLVALTVGPLVGSINATKLTSAGEQFAAMLSEAQQRAMANGNPVEVRLYKSKPGEFDEAGFRSAIVLEYFAIGQNDPTVVGQVPLTENKAIARRPLEKLPDGFVISEQGALSTLITNLPAVRADGTGVKTFMAQGNAWIAFKEDDAGMDEYRSFLILPDSTSLTNSPSDRWFMTVVENSHAQSPVASISNFYTIQIDPVNGRISTYRP